MANGFFPIPEALDLMPILVERATPITVGHYLRVVGLESFLGHGRQTFGNYKK
jgi:hypothetical protein